MYEVYLVRNIVNGKVYVGYTAKTSLERWKDHVWSKNKPDHFHFAINKHGSNSFAVELLQKLDTRSAAKEAEQSYIQQYNSYNPTYGYNSTLGGEGGEIPTEETRQKIGLASSLRTHSEETKKKMRDSHSGEKNHFFGKKHSDETIAAIKIKCKEKLSGSNNPWFGKTLSEEHKLKISLAKKGKPRICKKTSLPAVPLMVQ